MSRMRRLAAALAGLALLAAPAPGPAAVAVEKPIQPGALVQVVHGGEDLVSGEPEDAFCTLNFVFKDTKRRLYIGTAGHCARRTGLVALDENERRIGTVVYRELQAYPDDELLVPFNGRDFALIRVDKARYSHVSAAVRGWGGPTGVVSSAQTEDGDTLVFYGKGMVLGDAEPTSPRPGLLDSDTTRIYRSNMPVIYGDSGGPVIHEATGKALGIVSGFNADELFRSIHIGPMLAYSVARMKAAGWNLKLVTAQYGGGLPV